MPMSLQEARIRATNFAATNQTFGGTQNLPTQTLDAQAWAYISAEKTGPTKMIERCNPFDVMGQLADISALTELVARLRFDAQTAEGRLIDEVLADERLSTGEPDRKSIATAAHGADLAETGGSSQDAKPVVERLNLLDAEARDQRYAFRNEPGHPWNLLEVVLRLRERYCAELVRLLAKAEAVYFVLNGSFGLRSPTALLSQIPAGKNPMPVIDDWLRMLSIELEACAAKERVMTVYRYAVAMRSAVDPATLAKSLKQGSNTPVEFEVNLTQEWLALAAGEIPRVQGIGFAPVFGYAWPFTLSGDATSLGAWKAELRALQSRATFSGAITFPEIVYANADGKPFKFQKATEIISGVGGWGSASGTLSQHVVLQSSRRIVNRPATGTVKFSLGNRILHPATSAASVGLNELPQCGNEAEVDVVDVVIAVRVAIVEA